ncbi:hypothetical protein AQI95_30990 [Streptomyces yokosukanensis]|uniref:Secreted protein n=1 Tax=Streptomyces yokosukanensis TaxID=67386 RepID=A0A124HEP2_9ACTN|nr:hypothetical protein [Streptomyces yokosukanensis]KUN01363.1 hypothetical protein AQI95_30990 [Streptomyces yokosukanensis]
MRRGLVHVLAWLLATGAAVTLSWWGVHTVMAGTAYDPPRALPITDADTTTHGAQAVGSPTQRPSPSRRPSTGPATPSSPAHTPRTPGHSPTASAPASASGQVKSYDTDGGRAVFELGPAGATLVSATPGAGWSMQVWKTGTWIRVEFSRGTGRVSVICTWHDGPPHVEIGTY